MGTNVSTKKVGTGARTPMACHGTSEFFRPEIEAEGITGQADMNEGKNIMETKVGTGEPGKALMASSVDDRKPAAAGTPARHRLCKPTQENTRNKQGGKPSVQGGRRAKRDPVAIEKTFRRLFRTGRNMEMQAFKHSEKASRAVELSLGRYEKSKATMLAKRETLRVAERTDRAAIRAACVAADFYGRTVFAHAEFRKEMAARHGLGANAT